MEKKRILIVDDEQASARLLQANLEQTGRYEVRVEHQAELAVAAAREFRPDLVLLDLVMPRMSGSEAAGMIKADPEFKDTAIVFLTAAVGPNELAGPGALTKPFSCISKPACVEDIIQCIEQHLSM